MTKDMGELNQHSSGEGAEGTGRWWGRGKGRTGETQTEESGIQAAEER